MKVLIATLLLAFFIDSSAFALQTGNNFTLYLIRHAEKQQDGSPDPVLTSAGKNRSKQLAEWFRDKDIADIWSSDYRRTRDTAKPLLTQLGLELSIYDPRDQTALVRNLLDRRHNALVVGHSNTIPELARLLCKCAIADMDESEHDRLIVIAIVDGAAKTNILEQNQLFQP